jgi:sodium-coupled neutral amino acid transporter 2
VRIETKDLWSSENEEARRRRGRMMDSVQEQGGEVRDLEYKRNKKNQQQQSSETSPLLPSKRQDLLVIGEEEEEDDYHEASTPSAVFNLSTTIVGAGIMALPATMKVLGLPLGLLAILFAAILSENSIQALLRYSRPCKARSYGALMADAFGEAGRIAVQLCIIINNVGILIVYIVIIGMVMYTLPRFLLHTFFLIPSLLFLIKL